MKKGERFKAATRLKMRSICECQHLDKVIQYIVRNGTQDLLPPEQYIRWVDPSWQTAGWDFSEDTQVL